MNDLKVQLRKKHGSTYTAVQYTLWAEMLVGGDRHDSMDEPPAVPMFGAARPCGKTSRLNCYCLVPTTSKFWCPQILPQKL